MGAAIGMLLAACSPSAGPTPAATPSATPAAQTGGVVSAEVRVVPRQSSDLGFLIAAPVDQIWVEEGEEVKAGQGLMDLAVPDLELAVEAAEQGLIAAQQNEFIQSQGRRKWDGFKFVWVAGPPEQRTAAHARVLQAQASLEAAEAALEQSVVRAPFDGTVVAIHVQPGEVVQPARAVASIGELEQLQIETTNLSEREIARVRVGQAAEVLLDAIAAPLQVVVTRIDPIAGRAADGDVIYRVTMEPSTQPPDLLWGMTGIANIRVGE
jgi:HlyD family secretion protein